MNGSLVERPALVVDVRHDSAAGGSADDHGGGQRGEA